MIFSDSLANFLYTLFLLWQSGSGLVLALGRHLVTNGTMETLYHNIHTKSHCIRHFSSPHIPAFGHIGHFSLRCPFYSIKYHNFLYLEAGWEEPWSFGLPARVLIVCLNVPDCRVGSISSPCLVFSIFLALGTLEKLKKHNFFIISQYSVLFYLVL